MKLLKINKIKFKQITSAKVIFEWNVLLLDCMGGYDGGGFIQLPSGLRMCRRSDENSLRYVSADITLKYLQGEK